MKSVAKYNIFFVVVLLLCSPQILSDKNVGLSLASGEEEVVSNQIMKQ